MRNQKKIRVHHIKAKATLRYGGKSLSIEEEAY
jgi:hypothetical protein